MGCTMKRDYYNYNNYDCKDVNNGNTDTISSEERLMQMQEKQRKNAMGCITALFVAIALPFLAIGCFFIKGGFSRIDELKDEERLCNHKVAAIVSEINSSIGKYEDSDGNIVQKTYYTPVLKYKFNEREYSSNGPRSSDRNYNIGDCVDIYINPDDPSHVYIPSVAENNSSSPKALFFGGSVFLILGLGIPITALIATKRKLSEIS